VGATARRGCRSSARCREAAPPLSNCRRRAPAASRASLSGPRSTTAPRSRGTRDPGRDVPAAPRSRRTRARTTPATTRSNLRAVGRVGYGKGVEAARPRRSRRTQRLTSQTPRWRAERAIRTRASRGSPTNGSTLRAALGSNCASGGAGHDEAVESRARRGVSNRTSGATAASRPSWYGPRSTTEPQPARERGMRPASARLKSQTPHRHAREPLEMVRVRISPGVPSKRPTVPPR
jgi:hypothetical protein